MVCLPFRPCSVLSALSSRNVGLRGTSRFCVNPSLLRAFSAACLLRCVHSLLRAFSLRDPGSAACFSPSCCVLPSSLTPPPKPSYPILPTTPYSSEQLRSRTRHPLTHIILGVRVSFCELSSEVDISFWSPPRGVSLPTFDATCPPHTFSTSFSTSRPYADSSVPLVRCEGPPTQHRLLPLIKNGTGTSSSVHPRVGSSDRIPYPQTTSPIR